MDQTSSIIPTPLPVVDPSLPLRARKRTKILATLGPACDDATTVRAMLEAGVNAVRLNMSHGSRDDQLIRLKRVRDLSREMDRPVAILADLQGPKIRTGRLKGGQPVELIPGATLVITTADCPEGTVERVGTTYPGLSKDLKTGDTVLVDDGKMRLRVISVEGHEITTRVEVGGFLKNSKGLNLPGANISAPALSDKDREDLTWAIENGADFIALSFVRSARDIRHVKARIAEAGRSVPVIAKIERPDALSNIDGILAEADGIMVARGDLGIEISIERLPIVQKELIHRANQLGKLVITATQMLESMIEGEMPSRAEATDIANAVFDGTDAVMLSGETASGKHPVQAVAAMSSILLEAEKSRYLPSFEPDPEAQTFSRVVMSLSGAAHRICREINGEAILISSLTAEPALLLSKRRGRVATIAICTDERLWRAYCLYWGITAVLIDAASDLQSLLAAGIDSAIAHGFVRDGQQIVVLSHFDDRHVAGIKLQRI
jgi:pyruvate kinase